MTLYVEAMPRRNPVERLRRPADRGRRRAQGRPCPEGLPRAGPDTQTHYHQESIVCDYGYCITCHKAQGSEWDKVLVLEDCSYWDMNRWRYTAVTRAAAELVYCF
jgi:ATP-dependent exoDNAse (exonuclease V) alpha subunit